MYDFVYILGSTSVITLSFQHHYGKALHHYQSASRLTPNDGLLTRNYQSLLTSVGLKTSLSTSQTTDQIINDTLRGIHEQRTSIRWDNDSDIMENMDINSKSTLLGNAIYIGHVHHQSYNMSHDNYLTVVGCELIMARESDKIYCIIEDYKT